MSHAEQTVSTNNPALALAGRSLQNAWEIFSGNHKFIYRSLDGRLEHGTNSRVATPVTPFFHLSSFNFEQTLRQVENNLPIVCCPQKEWSALVMTSPAPVATRQISVTYLSSSPPAT